MLIMTSEKANRWLIKIFSFVITFTVMAKPTYAEDHSKSLQEHVHGESELTIVMENQSLEIQLLSPAMNLLGFEHEASSPKEIAAVDVATSQLRRHENFFLFSGSHCDHLKTEIDVSSLMQKQEHDHKHQNNSDKHEDDHEKGRHSEIVANYQYRCENSASITELKLALFEYFPGIHKMQVMWVKEMQQGSTTLTPNNPIIEFR